jgi:hypothetical protein
MTFKPSSEVMALAMTHAASLPKRKLGGVGGAPVVREVPISWKNRNVIDRATLFLARQRLVKNPHGFPNRVTRQQRRRLRIAGHQ